MWYKLPSRKQTILMMFLRLCWSKSLFIYSQNLNMYYWCGFANFMMLSGKVMVPDTAWSSGIMAINYIAGQLELRWSCLSNFIEVDEETSRSISSTSGILSETTNSNEKYCMRHYHMSPALARHDSFFSNDEHVSYFSHWPAMPGVQVSVRMNDMLKYPIYVEKMFLTVWTMLNIFYQFCKPARIDEMEWICCPLQ